MSVVYIPLVHLKCHAGVAQTKGIVNEAAFRWVIWPAKEGQNPHVSGLFFTGYGEKPQGGGKLPPCNRKLPPEVPPAAV